MQLQLRLKCRGRGTIVVGKVYRWLRSTIVLQSPVRLMKLLRNAVVIGLAALYDTVDGSALPFALDADGCVVDYQPGCAAQKP